VNVALPTASNLYQFDDPTSNTSVALTLPKPDFQPTDKVVNGVDYPALTINGQTIVAADTDGDGIADAGLYRLPMAPVNGVTYYMAVRIIDNNSALNLNTAYGPEGDAVPANGPSTADAAYPTWFPGSIDLQHLLDTSAGELNGATGVNQWRFSGLGTPPTLSAVGPIDDCIYSQQDAGNGHANGGLNIPDLPTARIDFSYITLNDALWNNLGRRVDNPAYYTINTSVANPRYNSFTNSDDVALAYKFCLRPASGAELCNAESCLPYTVGVSGNVPQVPYAPNQVTNWYNTNFAYAQYLPSGAQQNTNYPIRSLLVGRNPVSIATPAHSMNSLPQSTQWTAVTPGPTTVSSRPSRAPIQHPPWNCGGRFGTSCATTPTPSTLRLIQPP
jgi:hypothetical protein